MSLYTYYASLVDEVPEVPEGSILSRTIHDDDEVRIVLFRFATGEVLSEHTSTHAALLVFIEGQADLTLGDDQLAAEAGTFAHMTPNLPHSITAHAPTTMLLVMIKPR